MVHAQKYRPFCYLANIKRTIRMRTVRLLAFMDVLSHDLGVYREVLNRMKFEEGVKALIFGGMLW